MTYTIQEVTQLTGITSRTLRYYDQIDLLKPVGTTTSGKRLYGDAHLDQLQLILFYKELDVPLKVIKELLQSNVDVLDILSNHLLALEAKCQHLDQLLITVRKTIAHHKGEINMSDTEKFAAFKQNIINENERKYGDEIRKKYGDETIDLSNQALLAMDRTDYTSLEELEDKIKQYLVVTTPGNDVSLAPVKELVVLHHQWVAARVPKLSTAMYLGIADLYVTDDRFQAYYDAITPNGAIFLNQAIHYYFDK